MLDQITKYTFRRESSFPSGRGERSNNFHFFNKKTSILFSPFLAIFFFAVGKPDSPFSLFYAIWASSHFRVRIRKGKKHPGFFLKPRGGGLAGPTHPPPLGGGPTLKRSLTPTRERENSNKSKSNQTRRAKGKNRTDTFWGGGVIPLQHARWPGGKDC